MTAPHTAITGQDPEQESVTSFGPDFPFAYDDWLAHADGLGQVPHAKHGSEIAIIGAGMAGIVAAYELMKMGLKPVVYESRRLGGRLHSEPFKGAEGVIAELGGMRFPRSSTAFYHYLDRCGLETRPFPNPLAPETPSTVIDLEGQTLYVERGSELSPLLKEVGAAWHEALETHASFSAMQQAIRKRDVAEI
ncbi:MAG: NAD(P)/FAD-dependent oxidoreductase, partial [Gammaproteobacteria bacterium]|nr:NAD(P)/FAD-dependent oxidoreductase [Gammaproteobacteria bacterium]